LDGLQILFRALGKQDLQTRRPAGHQSVGRFARRLAITSATGLALPASTSCCPSARTFRRAKVCGVSSKDARSCSTALASPLCVMSKGSRFSASRVGTSAALALR
jgi:hypothetical protein